MHPEIIKGSPGTCPECGIELVPVKANSHSELHADLLNCLITTHHTNPAWKCIQLRDAPAGHDKHADHSK